MVKKVSRLLKGFSFKSMSADVEFDSLDKECRAIADKKHGNLAKLVKSRDSSKRMCTIGIFLSPLLVGVPLAWMECKRNAQIKHKLTKTNIDWNNAYQKCMKKKQQK